MKIAWEEGYPGGVSLLQWFGDEVEADVHGGAVRKCYGHVVVQSGPVGEVGVNGIQVDHLLTASLEILRSLNREPRNNRQTSLAITKVEEALHWLEDRTREREARGVEGTSAP